jgi:hypothetical protein
VGEAGFALEILEFAVLLAGCLADLFELCTKSRAVTINAGKYSAAAELSVADRVQHEAQ